MNLARLLLPFVLSLFVFESQSQNIVPDTDVKTLEGKTVRLRDQIVEGQITVVNFWATWCSPCKRELDAIAELYPEWQENYNVKIIALSIDNARAMAKVKPMVAAKEWTYDILLDPNQSLMQTLQFQSIPYTILVNDRREIVYTHSGYLPGDEDELEEKIAELVN